MDLSGLDETALSAFNVDGKQYGLPGNFSNVVLVYNKDLFDQAGVAYPTADWTQDDLQAAAEAIRALGDDIFGIYQPITYNEFYKVAAQYGGSLLNEDLTDFTINSPENVQAAQVMVDRVLVSNVQPTEVQMGGMGDWDLFMSGRLGMIPTGIWAFSTFAEGCDFAWDIAVEPGAVQKATALLLQRLRHQRPQPQQGGRRHLDHLAHLQPRGRRAPHRRRLGPARHQRRGDARRLSRHDPAGQPAGRVRQP